MTSPRAKLPQPVSIDFLNPTAINLAFSETFRRLQSKNHRIFKVAPLAHEISEGEIVFFDTEAGGAGSLRLYTKLNGSLRFVNLT